MYFAFYPAVLNLSPLTSVAMSLVSAIFNCYSLLSFIAFCSCLFLPPDATVARYMLWPCVCPSVCLSQVHILPQRYSATVC